MLKIKRTIYAPPKNQESQLVDLQNEIKNSIKNLYLKSYLKKY